MPQYPIPPWPDGHLAFARKATVGMDNPRFAHLPIVKAVAGGRIEIIRHDNAIVRELLATVPESHNERIREDWNLGRPFFLASNRLGTCELLWADRPIAVGRLEAALYSDTYDLSPAVAEASTLTELQAALEAEVLRVRVFTVDGWELVRTEGGRQVLVDTRRPDEKLRKADLPSRLPRYDDVVADM